MTRQKTDSERLEAVKEMLNRRNERITEKFLRQINEVCDEGFLSGLNAFDILFNEFIRFGKTMQEIKSIKEQIQNKGIDEVIKQDILDLPTYIDAEYIEMIESDLYNFRKVINSVSWYLPQKQALDLIDFNFKD